MKISHFIFVGYILVWVENGYYNTVLMVNSFHKRKKWSRKEDQKKKKIKAKDRFASCQSGGHYQILKVFC